VIAIDQVVTATASPVGLGLAAVVLVHSHWSQDRIIHRLETTIEWPECPPGERGALLSERTLASWPR
jgi:hypothetical protein